MVDRDLLELVSCAGVEDWNSEEFIVFRIPNKLKGQTFVHFPSFNFTLEMIIPDNRRVI